MAARYLLDTNTCIYALSGRYPAVVRRIDRALPGAIVLSVIVYGELLFGIAGSSRPKDALARLEALLQIVQVMELPRVAAERYGAIRADLERAGTPIGNNDLWIAAHALTSGLTLVTNNEREFRRVKGLKLDNWAR